MRTATGMLTTILLLGSASVAAAECAWVLWEQSSDVYGQLATRTPSWSLQEAFEAKSGCLEARTRTWKLTYLKNRSWEKLKGARVLTFGESTATVTVYIPDYTDLTLKFLCFPDTIDPREKK